MLRRPLQATNLALWLATVIVWLSGLVGGVFVVFAVLSLRGPTFHLSDPAFFWSPEAPIFGIAGVWLAAMLFIAWRHRGVARIIVIMVPVLTTALLVGYQVNRLRTHPVQVLVIQG